MCDRAIVFLRSSDTPFSIFQADSHATSLFTSHVLHLSFFRLPSISNCTVSTRLHRDRVIVFLRSSDVPFSIFQADSRATSLFTLHVLHLSFFRLPSISNCTVSTRLRHCNTRLPPFQTHLFEMVCPSPFFFLLSLNFKPHSLHPSPPSPPSRCNSRLPPFSTRQFVMVDNDPLSLFRSSCLLKPHASCVPSTPSFPFSL